MASTHKATGTLMVKESLRYKDKIIFSYKKEEIWPLPISWMNVGDIVSDELVTER